MSTVTTRRCVLVRSRKAWESEDKARADVVRNNPGIRFVEPAEEHTARLYRFAVVVKNVNHY